jgi:uncharacterized protein YecE (DUF72 family)
MKFGKVENPGEIDFTLPKDHPDTLKVFQKENPVENPPIYVGCAKWSKKDLKNFYPRGTKDELTYYAQQFNSIEMNSTFYRIFPPEQFIKWREKTPEGFRFFPKINQSISHYKQLNDVKEVLDEYLFAVSHLEDRLGTIFLQLHDRFSPKRVHLLEEFIRIWPKDLPLTVELRNTEWFSEPAIANDLYHMLEDNNISNTLVDTAGRRDIMHMRMTTPYPFIRYVGANHESDYKRLDDWVDRIEQWISQGMQELYFFVHQNLEVESPLLSAYLIEQLNARLGYDLKVPNGESSKGDDQLGLF